ncbi:MAG: GNAT family N-acetyltransferase [Archangium sp.]|nr:GNAT family N-acetyltransferase [Archangium sp.]
MLSTARLVLRSWRDDDLAPFAALNADAEVMRHFPSALTRDESDALAARIRSALSEQGWGLWAAEFEGRFVGFIGLARPRFSAHFTPCVELGWRLARDVQGRGLATEGAREALRWAREHLRDERRVSFTVPANVASRRVMEKLGLTHDAADDFDHPSLREGHPLRRHVLYRDR